MDKYIIIFGRIHNLLFVICNLIALAIGAYKYKSLNIPGKATMCILGVPFLFNLYMRYYPFSGPTTLPLHFIYFSNFIMLSVFFNYCLPAFTKRKIGIYIILVGFVFWLLNTLFFRPINIDVQHHDMSYFYYESFYSISFVILSLAALFNMFREQTFSAMKRNPVFWFLIIYLFEFGLNYVYDIAVPLVKDEGTYSFISFFLDWMPNEISIILLGLVFLKYPKKIVLE